MLRNKVFLTTKHYVNVWNDNVALNLMLRGLEIFQEVTEQECNGREMDYTCRFKQDKS